MFPLFLTFLFIFVIFIRLIIIEIVLQTAVGDSVKQVSEVLYPFEQHLRQGGDFLNGLNLQEVKGIPEAVKVWLGDLDEMNHVPDQMTQLILRKSIKPVVWSHIPDVMRGLVLKSNLLTVTHVTLPYLEDNQLMFGIELEYKVQIVLPFYRKEMVIRKSAQERVWFGA